MISAVLLAGGSGSRFGSVIPKQFVKIPSSDLEVALFSFITLMECPLIDEIVVVVNPFYEEIFQKIPFSKPIFFALPGTTRQESMGSGFHQTNNKSELILIHDAARPFLTEEDLEKTISAAFRHGASALGVPIKPTIKKIDKDFFIETTVNRENLVEIQTPQILPRKILEKGILEIEKNGMQITDEASLAELLDYPVKVVLGSPYNIKITTEEDMEIAHLFYLKRFSCRPTH